MISDRQWDWMVVQAMRRFGGGFVKALAEAYLHADEDNQARIRATWPEYWESYRQMAAARVDEDGEDWWDKP